MEAQWSKCFDSVFTLHSFSSLNTEPRFFIPDLLRCTALNRNLSGMKILGMVSIWQ